MIRVGFAVAVLTMAFLSASCSNLATVSDVSIPRLLTPVANAGFDDLIKQLQPFTEMQSLRSWSVYIRFLDAESAQRYREAEAILVLKRPDKIRLVVQIPVVKTKLAEMVSEANRFKVAIYPSDYRRFLIGANDGDYSKWREMLGDKGKSALVSARPFHFTDSLMMRPLNFNDQKYRYSIEEALIEEPDLRQTAKKGARIIRSFYVITESELSAGSSAPSIVRRKFWFDRTNQNRFSRQQVFDRQGVLITEVDYSDYKKLNASMTDLWPGVVIVKRIHDGYSARLTFSEERFEVNPDLPETAFLLENTENLPQTDLDKKN
ncbi:MAG: hypothetical protein IPJ07_03510 [Acidobacteria bacterium]|nr:hypothetical protein [Acidobacteriota bacterium]